MKMMQKNDKQTKMFGFQTVLTGTPSRTKEAKLCMQWKYAALQSPCTREKKLNEFAWLHVKFDKTSDEQNRIQNVEEMTLQGPWKTFSTGKCVMRNAMFPSAKLPDEVAGFHDPKYLRLKTPDSNKMPQFFIRLRLMPERISLVNCGAYLDRIEEHIRDSSFGNTMTTPGLLHLVTQYLMLPIFWIKVWLVEDSKNGEPMFGFRVSHIHFQVFDAANSAIATSWEEMPKTTSTVRTHVRIWKCDLTRCCFRVWFCD